MSSEEAIDVLRPCVDIQRWTLAVADGRPFDNVRQLLDHAELAAPDWTAEEIDQALSRHPRIGERPAGRSEEAHLSRQEQAGLQTSDEAASLIAEGNIAYERKFGRVFLIRARGRSSEEILLALTERLGHLPDAELRVVARELRDIALLRLEGIVKP